MFAKRLFGRKVTEFINKNLPFPSVSLLSKKLHENFESSNETAIEISKIAEALLQKGHKEIFVAEDATRVKASITYDKNLDECVGFVLPLDNNGLPKQNVFKCNSPYIVKKYFEKYRKAKFINAIVMTPLYENSKSKPICVYSTDNSYKFEYVMKRYDYLIREFAKYGVTVAGWSCDANSKLLKAQRLYLSIEEPTKQNLPFVEWGFFFLNEN